MEIAEDERAIKTREIKMRCQVEHERGRDDCTWLGNIIRFGLVVSAMRVALSAPKNVLEGQPKS